MEKDYFEDYTVGEVFVSPGRTITETDIVLFSAFTGDWHPLHTDVEYAAKTPFKERIAHGMLGLVVGMALPFRLGPYVSSAEELYCILRHGERTFYRAREDRRYHSLRGENKKSHGERCKEGDRRGGKHN